MLWKVWRTALFAAVGLVVLGGLATAQEGSDLAWSAPVNLSNMPTDSEYPAITADPSGMVHVLWGENYDTSTAAADAIYYTRWDGTSWSVPVDVLLPPKMPGAANRYPAVAAGQDGRLHVVWEGGFDGRIFYSSARADRAGSAFAWDEAEELSYGGSRASRPDIALDAQGNLHVVYLVPEGPDQGIYYTRSTDNGASWSAPIKVPATKLGADKVLMHPSLAAGQDGTLHLAWEWDTEGVLYEGNGVLYYRSTDSGNTWDEPLVVADGPFGYPDVATVGIDDVMLVWAGTGDHRFRFSQWSADGGLTWTAPLQTSEVGGYLAESGMAVDSAGVLHLAIVATDYRIERDAVLHLQWADGAWSSPEVVMLDEAQNADYHKVGLAISEGNLVHIVVQQPVDTPQREQNWDFEIYYSQRRVDSPHIAPGPLPTAPSEPQPAATVEPSPVPTATTPPPTPTQTPWAAGSSALAARKEASGVPAVVVGASSAAAVVAVAALAWRSRRRGR